MHVRAMSSPAKELVSAFWAMIFHIIIITIVIIIIIMRWEQKRKVGGKVGERWTGRGRESWGRGR